MVRSSKASSAARRAASSTKSVRVLPNVLAARSIRPRSSGLMRRLRDWRLGIGRIFYSSNLPYPSVMTLSLQDKMPRSTEYWFVDTFSLAAELSSLHEDGACASRHRASVERHGHRFGLRALTSR